MHVVPRHAVQHQYQLCSIHPSILPCPTYSSPVLSSAAHTTTCVQISRLTALLEASKLHAALSSEQLMADLADERMRSERLRAVRDDALLQRCGQQCLGQRAHLTGHSMEGGGGSRGLY